MCCSYSEVILVDYFHGDSFVRTKIKAPNGISRAKYSDDALDVVRALIVRYFGNRGVDEEKPH